MKDQCYGDAEKLQSRLCLQICKLACGLSKLEAHAQPIVPELLEEHRHNVQYDEFRTADCDLPVIILNPASQDVLHG